MWDEIKKIISPLAPVLGGMIGGPAGAAAGTILKQTLLGNKDASDEQLLQAVQGITPEQQLALKQAEYNYQISMAQIDATNTADARKRDVALNASTQLPVWVIAFNALTTSVLAYVNVGGGLFVAMSIIYLMKIGDLSPVETGFLGTLLGYWISEAKQTNTFYFGSTNSSRDKDKIIENITK
jgi:hypothetical protein